MKKYLIAGNWKMNTNIAEAVELASDILNEYVHIKNVDVLVCPPFTNIHHVKLKLEGSPIMIGAQNCHYEESGAFTGEISVDMLKSLGCDYIIIGHSERRSIFNEKDDLINKKARAILSKGLKPILCIGETLEERKAEKTNDVLGSQLSNDLDSISIESADDIVIAYEPVWAIGTGISAESEQIEDAHEFVRDFLKKRFPEFGDDILIQYGGSVKPDNADEILSIENVNGALIGGASLKAEKFIPIISAAQNLV